MWEEIINRRRLERAHDMALEDYLNKLSLISRVLAIIGALALFLMVILTSVDVACRYLLNAPIPGALEVTEFLVLIVIFSFIGYTQSQNGHISVDLLVSRFPQKVRTYIELFNHLVCFLLMILITYMGAERARELMEFGESSPNLAIPNYPFAIFLTIGCAVMCIEFGRNIVRLLITLHERNGS